MHADAMLLEKEMERAHESIILDQPVAKTVVEVKAKPLPVKVCLMYCLVLCCFLSLSFFFVLLVLLTHVAAEHHSTAQVSPAKWREDSRESYLLCLLRLPSSLCLSLSCGIHVQIIVQDAFIDPDCKKIPESVTIVPRVAASKAEQVCMHACMSPYTRSWSA